MAAGLEQIINHLAINIPLPEDSQKLISNSYNIVLNGPDDASTISLVDHTLDRTFETKSFGMEPDIINTFSHQGEHIKLRILNAAIHYRYRAIILPYYKISMANIYVYNINEPSSFTKMKFILHEMQEYHLNHAITFIVAHDPINGYIPNKSCEEGKIFSEKNGFYFIPVDRDPCSGKMFFRYVSDEIQNRLKYNHQLECKIHSLLDQITIGNNGMISEADKIVLLRKKLQEFMASYYSYVDKVILNCIYKALQSLADLAPINENDPISLLEIDPNNKISVSTGHQFDIKLLIQYHNTRSYQGSTLGEQDTSRWLLNPLTGTEFSLEDSHYIQKQAKKRNLQIMYLMEEIKLPEEQIYIPNFFALEQQLPHESPSNLHGTVNDPSF